ncbi:MAG: hypothetical protein LBJ67_17800 [Planctomycetaceae bacterium]|jgi:hypothetical protein|nr:hypothetical protein [Planctomycetaceae bacterium]
MGELNKRSVYGCIVEYKTTEGENEARKRMSQVHESYLSLRRRFLPSFDMLCRMYLSDDPKAELTKMIMEMSDLLDPPELKTVEEYENWIDRVLVKYNAIMPQDWSCVLAFFAKIRDESNLPTS